MPGNGAIPVDGYAKVRAMPRIDGETLRAWRRSRGWDVPATARQLRHAALDGQVMARITGTNTSDDAIAEMGHAAAYLADAHTRVAPMWELPPESRIHLRISEFNASPV